MATSGTPADADLRTYGRILWRRKWWVIGMAAAALAGAMAYVTTTPKEYSTSAQLLVQPISGSVPLNGAAAISSTDVATELQLLGSMPVVDAVEAALHLTNLGVSSSEVGTTDVLSVTATNGDPVLAAHIATAYAREFVTYETTQVIDSLTAAELQLAKQINDLELKLQLTPAGTPQALALTNQQAVLDGQLGQLQAYGAAASGGVRVVSTAPVPDLPSSPKKKTDAIIALMAGLVVGLGVAFTIDFVDDALRTKEDVERAAPDVAVLGTVPTIAAWSKKGGPTVVTLTDPTSAAAECYRSLRTSLQFAAATGELRTVLVSSPAAAEGKTSTVANLGVTLARAGQRVVLVSADLRRPRLASFFGLDERVGLTSVVLGQLPIERAVREVDGVPGLSVLPCGPVPPNPAEVVGGRGVAVLLQQLGERYDMVLVDSPPVLAVTDAVVLAQRTDAVILVVATDRSKRAQLAQASERLHQVEARLAGIVLNEARADHAGGYAYGAYQAEASPAAGSNGHRVEPAGRS